MISIIVPANNEQGYIGECLDHILRSEQPGPECEAATNRPPVQVIVVANGCSDGTAFEACERAKNFSTRGWQLDVLELAEGSKVKALNAGDKAAINEIVAYVDADIHVSPGLIAGLARVLDRPVPAYAGGRPKIRPAQSFVSERYARVWERLPFMASGVPGCGVYAVNSAGRARWDLFPDVISDDTFVRYHFTSGEMHAVPGTYSWPITEGFRNLVKVRRRQDQGLEEIRRLRPDLAARTECTSPDAGQILEHFLRDPLGLFIYSSVSVAVRTPVFKNSSKWQRGR